MTHRQSSAITVQLIAFRGKKIITQSVYYAISAAKVQFFLHISKFFLYFRPSRKRVPSEITFALLCKLQELDIKLLLVQAQTIIFCTNSCKFRKFVVILHANLEIMARYIIMAEEGEHVLLKQVREQLGLDLSDAELIYTGVGAINVIRSLQHLDREAELINIGYAGSANFDIGTWVEVTEVKLNHPAVSYKEPELKPTPVPSLKGRALTRAICYTNTDFVLASDYKDCVFDMELAFIAALGFKNLHSLKFVSDNLSLHGYHELTHGVE